jgi:hypothetical protein
MFVRDSQGLANSTGGLKIIGISRSVLQLSQFIKVFNALLDKFGFVPFAHFKTPQNSA